MPVGLDNLSDPSLRTAASFEVKGLRGCPYRKLALINLLLDKIRETAIIVSPADALIAPSGVYYDYVLANPPVEKKSSQTFTNEEGDPDVLAEEIAENLESA